MESFFKKWSAPLPHETHYFSLSSGIPSASATPLPYALSALRQFPMWRILKNSGASPIARAVFSQEHFLLCFAHQPEEHTRLDTILGIVPAEVPGLSCSGEFERGILILGLLLPLANAVRLVPHGAAPWYPSIRIWPSRWGAWAQACFG